MFLELQNPRNISRNMVGNRVLDSFFCFVLSYRLQGGGDLFSPNPFLHFAWEVLQKNKHCTELGVPVAPPFLGPGDGRNYVLRAEDVPNHVPGECKNPTFQEHDWESDVALGQ